MVLRGSEGRDALTRPRALPSLPAQHGVTSVPESSQGMANFVLCLQKCFIICFLLSTSSSRCCWAAPLHVGQVEGFGSPPDFHHTLGVWAITQ